MNDFSTKTAKNGRFLPMKQAVMFGTILLLIRSSVQNIFFLETSMKPIIKQWKKFDESIDAVNVPLVGNTIIVSHAKGEGDNPLQCQYKVNNTECCASWEVDTDDWWLHHPDWEVSTENEIGYCFAPMKKADAEKASFLRELHDFQWFKGNCSEVEKSCEINSGFGASTYWLLDAFWYSFNRNKTFQILNNGRKWLYSTDNNSSWAYCKDRDTRCYYLPISPCSREVVQGNGNEHKGARPDARDLKKSLHSHWMKSYLLRPKQHFRRKSFELRQNLNVSYPCTAMHVRRGDVGTGLSPFRRFAAVQEYLNKAEVQDGDNIVLLTDADSTIQEVKKLHPQYNWIYLDRQRHKPGIVNDNNHTPSGDEGNEMLAIDVEMYVASMCQKIVHGKSGFVTNLLNVMRFDGKNFTEHIVHTQISRAVAKEFNYTAFEQQFYVEDTKRE